MSREVERLLKLLRSYDFSFDVDPKPNGGRHYGCRSKRKLTMCDVWRIACVVLVAVPVLKIAVLPNLSEALRLAAAIMQ